MSPQICRGTAQWKYAGTAGGLRLDKITRELASIRMLSLIFAIILVDVFISFQMLLCINKFTYLVEHNMYSNYGRLTVKLVFAMY